MKKKSLKKKAQKEANEFAQIVDARFEAFNFLVCDGQLSQEMLIHFRDQAIQDNNEVDMLVCDMLIRQ